MHNLGSIDEHKASIMDTQTSQLQKLVQDLSNNSKNLVPNATLHLSASSSVSNEDFNDSSYDQREVARTNILQTAQDIQDLLLNPSEFLDQYQLYVSAVFSAFEPFEVHLLPDEALIS